MFNRQMPAKLDYSFVKEQIEKNGDILVSKHYDTVKELLTINCFKCKKDYNQNYDRYRQGFRHKTCSKKEPLRGFNGKKGFNGKIPWVKIEMECKMCKNTFIRKQKDQYLCSKECTTLALKEMAKSEKFLEHCSRGGKISCSKQVLRSKNEIYFADLCKEKFEGALTNIAMFDGWDADVIIPILRIAIHWNGKWHYQKIKEKHNLENTQNRDAIKLKVIAKYGYTSYTIKDMGKADKNFVEREFEKFLNYIYFM